MSVRTITNYLAPGSLALSAALAIGNWWLRPDRAAAWVAALIVIGCMGLAWFRASRGSAEDGARGKREDSIRAAIVFAALMLLVGLGNRLATASGAASNPDFALRAIMAIAGAFLAFTGNAIPKMLTPLASLRCDPARAQAALRFAGWTWVLAGVADCVAWLALPIVHAQTVMYILLPAAMLATFVQPILLRVRRKSI
ncbi:MAG TPA: hypothetical protein VHZ09_02255 [Acidobacteriaceae bacterium]|jgi:hypothetical protein|nr:hypothetical protein [Acidobacteriaceae bacterium]